MRYWLAKTEPGAFSYDNLERLGRDRWDGVRNFAALKHISQMGPDDLVFIYHSGDEKAVVGVATVIGHPYPDPTAEDKRLVVVDLAAKYRLPQAISLKQIKADPLFSQWELVRQPRLSVMPVAPELWNHLLQLATVSS
jgi:predicted RNA-binding protein with PUA-like domain